MADRHVVGDTVRLKNTFKVAGTVTDPTTVALVVTDPSLVATTYTWAGAEVTKASTGVFYRDVTVDEAGLWTYKFTGTGTAADVVTRTFTVQTAAVESLDVLTYDEAAAALKIGTTDIDNSARLQQAITGISRTMDDRFGPIVKRAVTEEAHPCGGEVWVTGPIYSTPGLTVTEYDTSGTSTVLSLEDYDTKPANGYRLERRSGLGGGYTGRICRRVSTAAGSFGETVLFAYTAGRYSDTGTVDAVFKESASVSLINWWQQVLAQIPQAGQELDLPGYRFPRYAVPDAALDIVPRSEHQTYLGMA